MNVHQSMQDEKRLTNSEEVFRQLKSDIISMRLKPGTKLSEVEIAKTFDVSRQPVREAFMRLSELSLLQIRPQRATCVRKISLTELRHTRFLRASVEVEVVRAACKVATDKDFAVIQENLDQQKIAVTQNDPDQLHELDYLFHKQICIAADCLPAFKTISENKSHTERVCTLELSDACGMKEILEGHTDIFEALKKRDEETAVKMTRIHLRHLDGTLENASKNFPEFFEE